MSTKNLETLTTAPIPHPTKLAIWLADAIFSEHRKTDGTCNVSDSALNQIARYLPANVEPLFWKSLNRPTQSRPRTRPFQTDRDCHPKAAQTPRPVSLKVCQPIRHYHPNS